MMTIEAIFLRLGVVTQLISSQRTMLAIRIALESEDRLFHVVKEIYQPIADQYNCSCQAVERNIHAVVRKAWHNNPEFFYEIAGSELDSPPKSKEFLEIIYTYIVRGQ